MKSLINPDNYSQNYLAMLNQCFPNWGNEATFDWVINRSFDGFKPDYFILKSDADEVLAGSAISYRKLKTKGGNEFSIGIMTGSWTLPQSRGLGCFTETIKISNQIIIDKKIDFLTAFVTESNASYRRLKDAGSQLIATNYIISENLKNNTSNHTDVKIIEKTDENIQLIYEKRKHLLQNKLHFEYSFIDFKKQFLNRINPTYILNIGNEYAIVEETTVMFQLHYATSYSKSLVDAIVVYANLRQKEIIFFIVGNNHDFLDILSYKIVSGFFTVLANKLSETKYADQNFEVDFDIQYGDKM